MQNGTANLEENYLPKSAEYLCPHKNLHMNVYSSFIHNHQNLEVTKISFSWWMDKETLAYPDNGILFSTKKKWAIKSWKDMEKTQMHITKWNKPI